MDSLCLSLSQDMDREQIKGKVVSLKLKTDAFEVTTRDKTVPRYVSSYDEIFRGGWLLGKWVGWSVGGLVGRSMGRWVGGWV